VGDELLFLQPEAQVLKALIDLLPYGLELLKALSDANPYDP